MSREYRQQNAKYEKYRELAKAKNFAINKAYEKFYFLPLEKQDLEILAWNAFVEVEEIYETKKGRKTYESFFMDLVQWKCSDYCLKYINNKHKVLNVASHYDYVDESFHNPNEENEIERLEILKSILEEYKVSTLGTIKGDVLEKLSVESKVSDICKELNLSKSKAYKIIKEIEKELRLLLN